MKRKNHYLLNGKIACGCVPTCKLVFEDIKDVNCKKCLRSHYIYTILKARRSTSTKEIAFILKVSSVTVKSLRQKYDLKRFYEKQKEEGEIWKTVNEFSYLNLEVSNFGKFRNKETGYIYNLVVRKNRLWLWTKFKNKNVGSEASRIIYRYFVDATYNKIPHMIDGNYKNIRFNNLTSKTSPHKNRIYFLEKTKNEVEKWFAFYNHEDFKNASYFGVLAGIPYHKMCSYVYSMKKYLNIEKVQKIKFLTLCLRFACASNIKASVPNHVVC